VMILPEVLKDYDRQIDAWLMEAIPKVYIGIDWSVAKIASHPFWTDGPDCLAELNIHKAGRRLVHQIIVRVLNRLVRHGRMTRRKFTTRIECHVKPMSPKHDWKSYTYFKRVWHYLTIAPDDVLDLMACASTEKCKQENR